MRRWNEGRDTYRLPRHQQEIARRDLPHSEQVSSVRPLRLRIRFLAPAARQPKIALARRAANRLARVVIRSAEPGGT